MAAPSFSYTLKISQLDGKTRLPDGDLIAITPSGDGPPGVVTFALKEAKGRWWKGIVHFASKETNAWTEIAAGSGNELNDPKYKKKTGEVDHSDLEIGFLVLSKAKLLGTHSNVYLLQDAAEALQSGRCYTVDWIAD
ncbi:MAG TPA: hypothetical protein VIL69_18285 [Roseomonas sp.]|jgi:hypothetical protein